MGIATERFWALTPAECVDEIRGFYDLEREREARRTESENSRRRFAAAMVACLMNCLGAKPKVTADSLIGTPSERNNWGAKADLYFRAMTKGD